MDYGVFSIDISNYIDNIDYTLYEGQVENYKLKQKEILRQIFNDNNLSYSIYKKFQHNFTCAESDLLMKTNDMIYRLDRLVNEFIIGEKELKDIDSIKDELKYLIDDGIDLYSAVNYGDESFDEIFDDLSISNKVGFC